MMPRFERSRRTIRAFGLALSMSCSLSGAAWAQNGAPYRVQALRTDDLAEARARARIVYRQLQASLPVYVLRDSSGYRVRAGDHTDVSEARGTLARLRELGYDDAWITTGSEPSPTELLRPSNPSPEGSPASGSTHPHGPSEPTAGTTSVGTAATPVTKTAPRPVSSGPAATPSSVDRPAAPHGVIEAGDCEAVLGWAWDSERPDDRVEVEVFEGDTPLGNALADRPRPDLATAGKGDGGHGFSFLFPKRLSGGREHRIRVRVVGSSMWLMNTPLTVECPDDGKGGRATFPVASTGPDAFAGEVRPSGDAAGVRKHMSARRVDDRIVVDGKLDDAAWMDAIFDARFDQKGPDRSFPARERTEVAFAFDDDALYVAARMFTPHPELLRARVRERDDPGNAERLLVSLDTYGDGRTAYTFGVTTGGVRLDHLHASDDELDQDDSWDPVWDARAVVDSTGWSAEFRIPFSELRFDRSDGRSWGVNVRRWSPERFLNVYWVAVPLYESGWISRFGRLDGLEGLSSTRTIAIRPYALAGATVTDAGARGADDPASALRRRFGADASFALGSNVALEATVNPDFGQIEADPAEVNLTQFETFFEERRPFFTEGSQLIDADGPRYFYSRRVGGLLPGGVPSGIDEPTGGQTILGAAKAAGRLDSGLSFGSLVAVTGRETGPATATDSMVEAAAPTLYGVGRVKKAVGPEGSTVGMILTGVRRSFEQDSPVTALLPRTAISGGADWLLRLSGGDVEVSGFAGFSHVAGDPGAMLRLQRSSARYFQRPDASHVRLDSTATSLTGWTAGASVKELAGQWLFEGRASYESPGLELQDAGILTSTDDIDASGGITYRQPRAHGPLREFSVSLFMSSSWNTDGIRRYTSPAIHARGTLPNLWRLYAQASYAFPALSDDLTRGGPLMGTPSSWSARAGILSRFGAPTDWSASVASTFDAFGGWTLYANGGLSAHPGRNWELSLYPGFVRSDDSRQFFGTYPGGSESTFGTRYVFSRLVRTELYAQLRVGYAVTPDLSIQLYAEPFASSGRFHDFGELEAARSDRLRSYGSDGTTVEELEDGSLEVTDGGDRFVLWNSNYQVRSFRTNAVLRWEWRRGSTFYLIWQQNRWWSGDAADPVGIGSLFAAPGDAGEHVLAAKLSYWLPIR